MTKSSSDQPVRKPRRRILLGGCLAGLLLCLVAVFILYLKHDPTVEYLVMMLSPDIPPLFPSKPASVISSQNFDNLVEVKRLSNHRGPIAWSPDSQILAIANGLSVTLREMPGGHELRTFTLWGFDVDNLSFSLDGKFLATVNNGSVTLWEVDTGRQERVFGEGVYDVAFSPDGKMVAVAMRGPAAILLDLVSLKERYTFTDPKGEKFDPAYVTFSPDGEMLALGSSSLTLWNVTTGELIKSIPDASYGYHQAFFLENGKAIAAAGGVWDVDTGRQINKFDFAPPILCVAFSPDGSLMAFEQIPLPDFGPPQVVELRNVKTMAKATLGPKNVSCPLAFSPDGKLLATGNGSFSIKLWGVSK